MDSGEDSGAKADQGVPAPSLDSLVDDAKAKQPPQENDKPYERPDPVTVPVLEQPDLEVLPKSEEGYPLIQRGRIDGLAIDPSLADPITALGTCLSLVLGCVPSVSGKAGPDFDSCVISAPQCESNEPWAENDACCPARCQELYEALRQEDYSQSDAWILVGGSYCVPGLKEQMEASQ
jgi:hypothetical protein